MSKLDEIERRLAAEPDNLGLRVAYAGALRDAGRRAEAIEQYRAVAFAYRYQGRTQQAIAVCRGILELAPGDGRSLAMLTVLEGRGATEVEAEAEERPSHQWDEETPLPRPVPYHVATPTLRSRRTTDPAVSDRSGPIDRPAIRLPTQPATRPVTPLPPPAPPRAAPRPVSRPQMRSESPPLKSELPGGLGNPAARVSTTFTSRASDDEDLSAELETRRIPQIAPSDLDKIALPPPTVPIDRISPNDLDDVLTPPALGAIPASDFDDIATRPVTNTPKDDDTDGGATEDTDTGSREVTATRSGERDDPTVPERRNPAEDD